MSGPKSRTPGSGGLRSGESTSGNSASGNSVSGKFASASDASNGAGPSLLRAGGFTAPHGFSTRLGGFSSGPYASLNLRDSTGDDTNVVEQNQRLFAGWFGMELGSVAQLKQVHGTRVVEARAGGAQRADAQEADAREADAQVVDDQEADAQVSADPALLLVIGTADCFPLLFHHPASGVVAAAHCGWRGTVAGLAAETVRVMANRYGCDPRELQVAIGPGICASCYQVGADVVDEVRRADLPGDVATADDQGRWRLDLASANRHFLEQAGVAPEAISSVAGCTSCEPERFYSHRRDRGLTGRHWAAVRATSVG